MSKTGHRATRTSRKGRVQRSTLLVTPTEARLLTLLRGMTDAEKDWRKEQATEKAQITPQERWMIHGLRDYTLAERDADMNTIGRVGYLVALSAHNPHATERQLRYLSEQTRRYCRGAIHHLQRAIYCELFGKEPPLPEQSTDTESLTPEQEADQAAKAAKGVLLVTLATYAMQERSEAETKYLDSLPDWHTKSTYESAIEALRLAMDSVADPEYIKRGVTCPGTTDDGED